MTPRISLFGLDFFFFLASVTLCYDLLCCDIMIVVARSAQVGYGNFTTS